MLRRKAVCRSYAAHILCGECFSSCYIFRSVQRTSAGKTAAANIDEYLGFRHEITTEIEFPGIRFDDHKPLGRINMKERPAAERRNDFKLMECPMSDEEACQESGRCLHCDHFGYGIFKGGRVTKW